jgi:hypothetical protein
VSIDIVDAAAGTAGTATAVHTRLGIIVELSYRNRSSLISIRSQLSTVCWTNASGHIDYHLSACHSINVLSVDCVGATASTVDTAADVFQCGHGRTVLSIRTKLSTMCWTNANVGQLINVCLPACHATSLLSIGIVDATEGTTRTAPNMHTSWLGCTKLSIGAKLSTMCWTNATAGQHIDVRLLAPSATTFVFIDIMDAAAGTAGTATIVHTRRRTCAVISIRA